MSKLEPTRTYSNPTATDVLRRLLDERGVKWEDASPVPSMKPWKTSFTSFTGEEVSIGAYDEPKWLMGTMVFHTPEQAIAATLGATDARPTQVESSGTCEADETDTWECVCDGIGNYGKRLTVHVMECTECGHVYEHVNGDYEYCPRCGRKRRDVEE